MQRALGEPRDGAEACCQLLPICALVAVEAVRALVTASEPTTTRRARTTRSTTAAALDSRSANTRPTMNAREGRPPPVEPHHASRGGSTNGPTMASASNEALHLRQPLEVKGFDTLSVAWRPSRPTRESRRPSEGGRESPVPVGSCGRPYGGSILGADCPPTG